jgi:hypothetical protein
MKLRVLQAYASAQARYPAGVTIDVEDAFGAWLQRDAPECFAPYVEEKAPESPPEDKAVKSPPARKSVRSKNK